ncbi:MAG: substrate-binding domain-containing protein, partial [Alphaproteobacteria bacterium]|nr:substrate-binding domain-containing protein [Alphaproteobacteria bacterium]
GFFRHAAQGLEERKQIIYLLGPVGGGKSSLAERLKTLMEKGIGLAVGSLVLAVSALMAGQAAARGLALHGAATLAKNLVIPNQARIEDRTGHSLSIVMNGSGNGLADLAAGRADLAMISAPIEVAAAAVDLDPDGMIAHPVGRAVIRVMVNPANRAALTQDAVRAIFTGGAADWSEVGGPAGPIQVVVEAPGQGTRATLEAVFLGGRSVTPEARVVPVLAHLAQIAGQAPNAISYGNGSSIQGASVRLVEGIEIAQPLLLVTKGAPTPEARALIDAIAALGAE